MSELMPIKQAKQRHAEKTCSVLMFLYQHKWSHQDVLQLLLGLSTRQAIHKTLLQLQKRRVIKKHSLDNCFGSHISIWGITATGIDRCVELNHLCQKIYAFEPSKFKALQMRHKLDIQLTQIRAEKAGWRDVRFSGLNKKAAKKPDLIATRPDKKIICFEIERSLKTPSLYSRIVVSHLEARKRGSWDEIYYLMPNENIKQRVANAINTLKVARYKNRVITLTEAHKEPFKFFNYNERWEQP